MPAYVETSAREFLDTPNDTLLAKLHRSYAADGFVSQYTSQTVAWEETLPVLKESLRSGAALSPTVLDWRVLLELPLYRLRRRIDVVLVSRGAVVVIELKVGEKNFSTTDRRQAEEYALDLRDFHEHSHSIPLIPVLWCTEAEHRKSSLSQLSVGVAPKVLEVGKDGFPTLVGQLADEISRLPPVVHEEWATGAYHPVPSVIDAAMTLFAGHGVDEITRADAANLRDASERILSLIEDAQASGHRALIFLTGVPGSGKTLAGLQVVHRAKKADERLAGDVVYLSGNTPLVTVLREALTEDKHRRHLDGGEAIPKYKIRSKVRTQIQHIIDFLREHLTDPEARPPYNRAIVFDEAQRAWDEKQGKKKFGRMASEPRLLLDIMGRHPGWSAIVGLIGGGQEINDGEKGMREWGDALRSLDPDARAEWRLYGPPGMTDGDNATAFLGLGTIPGVRRQEVEDLALRVPLRSFRSPKVADWVSSVLDGDASSARDIMEQIEHFPVLLTRSSDRAVEWLRGQGRGTRRFGLIASSGSKRLRAEGFGVTLNAGDGTDIAHWYLSPRGDVRSSFALEVIANQYTTQGLELDFVGVCWGGDLRWAEEGWLTRHFSGTRWQNNGESRRRLTLNSYRVLLTRAREGLVIWVPRGDPSDPTRDPKQFDMTAEFLAACGAAPLDNGYKEED